MKDGKPNPKVIIEVSEANNQCFIYVRKGLPESTVKYVVTGIEEPPGGWMEGEEPEPCPEDMNDFECVHGFAI